MVEPTPLKKYARQNGFIFPKWGETKKYLKPPPRWRCISSKKMVVFQLVMFVFGGTKQTLLLRKYGTCKACVASSSWLWSELHQLRRKQVSLFEDTDHCFRVKAAAVPKNVWKIRSIPTPRLPKNPKKNMSTWTVSGPDPDTPPGRRKRPPTSNRPSSLPAKVTEVMDDINPPINRETQISPFF